MDKKGFTLIELILVIGIIGVILAFAIPNVTTTLEKNKKDQMIADAKDMAEKAKNYILINGCKEKLILDVLDTNKEIKNSPYGGEYDRNGSYVMVNCKENKYYIFLTSKDDKGNSVTLSNNNNNNNNKPIELSELNSNNKYNYIKVN